MSEIPGERRAELRRNFHGTRGEHLFPHPATYARRSDWTAWERRYAAHLNRHKELTDSPEPQPGDPQVVTDLFAHIAILEQVIAKEKKLIAAFREQAAAGGEPDEKDARAVRIITRGGQ
jgi:hypothetical protein